MTDTTTTPSFLRRAIIALDRTLRGEATSTRALSTGHLDLPTGGMSLLLILLAMTYGLCVGVFALLNPPRDGLAWAQVLSTTLKMPLLFILTLLVTFPSLYVFNTLVGSRLTLPALLNLMTASMGVTLATLASFGPIIAFFSVTTTSKPFIVLLNVFACAIAGALGLVFLLQTLNRLTIALDQAAAPVIVIDHGNQDDQLPRTPTALETPDGQVLAGHTKRVFQCWIIVFGLVGSQMSWVLRPFFGSPNRDFVLFSGRESNFFQAVVKLFGSLFS
jgi:hypothetical protein